MSNSTEVGRAPGMPPGRRLGSSLVTLAQRFAREDRGTIAPLFALMVIPFSMSVGMAVDYGRIVMVQQKTQGMIDAAVLAGGRAYQQATSNKLAAMEKAIDASWASMSSQFTTFIEGRSIQREYVASTGQVRVVATQWVRTPFMSSASLAFARNTDPNAPGICNQSGWFCAKVEQMAGAQVKTQQWSGEDKVELALMVDVTGSMDWIAVGSAAGSTTPKIDELKSAAQSLIDILLPANTSSPHKVSLVPFSDAVHVDDTIAEAASGTTTTCSSAVWSSSQSKYTGTITNAFSTCDRFVYRTRGTNSDAWRNWLNSPYRKGCAIARYGANGTYANSDASPSVAKVDKFYGGNNCSIKSHGGDINQLVPLTNDRNLLTERISELQTGGSTGGHIGTAWAWYTLSPNWKTVFTGNSQPAEYNAPKVKKIAVLMTDGAYTASHCKGVFGSNIQSSPGVATCDTTYGSVYEPRMNGSYTVETGGTKKSSARAAEICTAMKTAGVIVYTVGFDLANDTAAKDMLKNCATTESHFYDASTGAQIKLAFEDIALKATALRLSK